MNATLAELASRWAPVLGLALVQNTLFLLLLLGALRLLRHSPAWLRHAVGVLGLAKLLLPPFVPIPAAAPIAPEAVMPRLDTGIPGGGFFLPWTAPAEGLATSASPAQMPGWGELILWLWLAGFLFHLLLPLFATLRLGWRLRTATEVTPDQLVGMGLDPGVGVHRSDRIDLPMIFTLHPKRIYVPTMWDTWDHDCRRLFLRHEQAHIRRADGMVQVIQIVAGALWFFHPLVIVLNRRLDEYREMACDDAALDARPESPIELARYLIRAAETALDESASRSGSSALLRRKNELLRRVDHQLKGGAMLRVPPLRTSWIVVGLLVCALSLSWTLAGETAPSPRAPTSSSVAAIEGEAPTPEDPPPSPNTAYIVLGETGRMDMNGESTVISEVSTALMRMSLGMEGKPSEDIVIHLRCEDGVPMEEVYAFHRLLQKLELNKIEYVGTGIAEAQPLMLPNREQEAAFGKLPPEHVAKLHVDADGVVTLDGKEVESSGLEPELARRLAEDEYLVVAIATDPKTRYGDFLTAFTQTRASGCRRVAILPVEL